MDQNQLETKKKASFTGSFGFIMAAAGSAVGLGNLWRFPYLAAKDGGGIFLVVYLLLVLTFGFSLLATDILIGRKTGKSSIGAFEAIGKRWKFLGILTFIVPSIIITYYSVIGGWILKYLTTYVTFKGSEAASGSYFNDFITAPVPVAPIVFMLIYLAITAFIVYLGVEKGIEKFSKVIMPVLIIMVVGIAVFSLTLKFTDEAGVVRTGLEGAKIYLVPNFEGMTFSRFMGILLDAMSQLFFSLSVSMGIMITYGSYVKKDVNLSKSIGHIEIFDTLVAFLSGLMILPAVYAFQGVEGMSQQGPGLLFKALPNVFEAMGGIGDFVGIAFFLMVAIAALTSSVSIMEAIVGNCMQVFHTDRKKVSLIVTGIAAAGAVLICLGYNALYFELNFATISGGQLLDVFDYISNNLLMPVISLLTCVLIGWVLGPKWAIDEMEASGDRFGRKRMYVVIIKYVAPVLMVALLLKSIGVL